LERVLQPRGRSTHIPFSMPNLARASVANWYASLSMSSLISLWRSCQGIRDSGERKRLEKQTTTEHAYLRLTQLAIADDLHGCGRADRQKMLANAAIAESWPLTTVMCVHNEATQSRSHVIRAKEAHTMTQKNWGQVRAETANRSIRVLAVAAALHNGKQCNMASGRRERERAQGGDGQERFASMRVVSCRASSMRRLASCNITARTRVCKARAGSNVWR
jgi:hypothetical protein